MTFQPRQTPRGIYDSTLELLVELCALPSPSGDADGLRRVAEVYAGALARRGLETTIHPCPAGDGSASLPVLEARGAAADDDYLFAVGHLDTVLRAREPVVEGHLLRATGAVDMKGGLAALVGALDLLAARGRADLARDLRVAVVPDEEVAGPISQQVMEEHGDDARGVWVLEPGAPYPADAQAGDRDDETRNAETVVIGRRGMFHWHADVRGRSAHAGNGFWDGRSALSAAAEWWLAAEALARRGGPSINAGRLVAGEADFLADLAAHGGLLGSVRQVNVVPDRARIEGEARFLATADGESVKREMTEAARRIAEERGVEIEFRAAGWIPPVEPRGPSRAWAETAERVAAGCGWTLHTETDRAGISFSNFLSDPGALPILDGLGPVGGGMHTREEFVDLRSLDRRIRLLADLFEALA